MAGSIEDRVKQRAIKYAKAAKGKGHPKVGKGICWELVRSILTSEHARTDQDYPKNAKDPALSPWGKADNDYIPCYIMVFENATLTQSKADSSGRVSTSLAMKAHVGIIVDVKPGGVVTLIHQNAPPGSAPHGTQFSMSELSGKWATFAPEAKP